MLNIQKIDFHSTSIRYAHMGEGLPVVLLHGYLESLDIWDSFAEELSKNYLVITIDLPGHGQSGTIEGKVTVEIMAEAIAHVLDYLKIEKAVIIGHSMGGYAMLAFAELWPGRLLGIGLFHSVSWADLPEKREARDREIELIRLGKKQLICNANVPKSFADDNLETFSFQVERAKEIAIKNPDDGIIAVLNAMKARKDRTLILKDTLVPVFFAIGKKDNYIPVEKMLSLTIFPARKHVAIFENSGHMAFIEEKDVAIDEISQFLAMC
jgi:pimeloyl-ACP methyl ester carboxylesterase